MRTVSNTNQIHLFSVYFLSYKSVFTFTYIFFEGNEDLSVKNDQIISENHLIQKDQSAIVPVKSLPL